MCLTKSRIRDLGESEVSELPSSRKDEYPGVFIGGDSRSLDELGHPTVGMFDPDRESQHDGDSRGRRHRLPTSTET
jgi:hypothetical protein